MEDNKRVALKVVFVLGSFYPRGSAVGNCVLNVAAELATSENVSVICRRQDLHGQNEFIYEGITVSTVDTAPLRLRLKLENRRSHRKMLVRGLASILLFILRLFGILLRLLSPRFFDEMLIRSYEGELEKSHASNSIDLLVPCASPYEACVAAMTFKEKHPRVCLVPYMFDTLVGNTPFYLNSKFIAWLYRDMHVKTEENLLSVADRVICMRHFFEEVSKYHNNTSNLIVAEHPLLVPAKFQHRATDSAGEMRLVFTGALYRKIRNPISLLLVLELLFDRLPNLEVHFYGGGDCKSILEEFALINPLNFFNHGLVSLSEAKLAQSKATALLSIGNSTNFQLPSKIFEYMSTSLPIIHFANNSHDNSIEILRKYPNHLILDQETESDAEMSVKVVEFLNQPRADINLEYLKSTYSDALPSYTANLMLDVVIHQS